MRPSNERELAIARTVDKFVSEGRLDPAIDKMAAALGFPVIGCTFRSMLNGGWLTQS
jgi:hypothetical protein